MNVNPAALCQAALGEIFSYLEPKDLGRVSQVCRNWNAALKLDCVWQSVARSILDLPKPSNVSWKEQCQILHRWKTGNVRVVPLPVFSYGGICFFDDNSAFEMVVLDLSRPNTYLVRDLFSLEELSRIDLAQYGIACYPSVLGASLKYSFGASAIHGSVWTILCKDGGIFQFDLKTGACINQFPAEVGQVPHMGRERAICSNDHEIITSVSNRVKIRNLQEPQRIQTFDVEEGQGINRLFSTPHFVVCVAYKKGDRKGAYIAFAVNKKNPTIRTRIELKRGSYMNLACQNQGSYCSFPMSNGGVPEVCIYEDTPDEQFRLARTFSIKGSLEGSSLSDVMRMYGNWLCVSKVGVFLLFDVRNGREILSFKVDSPYRSLFQLDAQGILAYDLFCLGKQDRRFYDFSGRVRQLPLSTWCTVM